MLWIDLSPTGLLTDEAEDLEEFNVEVLRNSGLNLALRSPMRVWEGGWYGVAVMLLISRSSEFRNSQSANRRGAVSREATGVMIEGYDVSKAFIVDELNDEA